ncbi:MAG: hypothetical protein JWN27_1391, partial [Candidatus Eremiobacteraeota bacterium]|nr:hypothetical protein [Candidatus Eremiobacteraeota bacterium]
ENVAAVSSAVHVDVAIDEGAKSAATPETVVVSVTQ